VKGGRGRSCCCEVARYELRAALARAQPGDHGLAADEAAALHDVGICLRDLGERAEAAVAFDRALALRRKLADEHPQVKRYQVELGQSLTNLGVWHSHAGRREQALACYRQARDLQARLVKLDPGAAVLPKVLAEGYFNIGACP